MNRCKCFSLLLLSVIFLLGCLLAACAPAQAPTPTPEPIDTLWEGDPIVHTHCGPVKGFHDENNTWVWKAIPFAKPPVGELRWKAPQEPEPWEAIRAETEFCERCSQPDPISGKIVGSEDCLYLNVWRPQTEETDLPVYVWIHGGGNSIGSAVDEMYWGANLASKSKVVYVSMNYRLGPLGWFTHPALRTGDKEDDSGNYGTLDIIQALKWVHSNIEGFGGDPHNVTIAGESAGGINTLSLLLSPLAHGLFHKAISQSGAAVGMPVKVGEESAKQVILKLLLNDAVVTDEAEAVKHLESMSNAEIAAYARSKSYGELHACYETGSLGFSLLTFPFLFTDGTVIVADGVDAFETGTYPNKVPIILGTNKDEMKLFLYFNPAFPDKDGELYQAVAKYTSDLWKVAGADGLASKVSSHSDQPDVYVYQFLWGSVKDTGESVLPDPFGSHLGAFHSLDVSFFLGNDYGIEDALAMAGIAIDTKQNRPGRLALQDAITSYVAQFVRTGDPATGRPGSNLPRWSSWSNNEGEAKCILLNARYDAIDIRMSTLELTEAGIRTEIDTLPETIAEAIRKASLF